MTAQDITDANNSESTRSPIQKSDGNAALVEAKLLFANQDYQKVSETLEKLMFDEAFSETDVNNAEIIYFYGLTLFMLHSQRLTDKSSDMILNSLEQDLLTEANQEILPKEAKLQDDASNPSGQPETDDGTEQDNAANEAEEEGEEDEAESLLVLAWENTDLARKLLENSGLRNKLLISIYILLVEINMRNNVFDNAKTDCEEALKLAKSLGKAECQNEIYKCLYHLATINYNLERFEDAKDIFQECLQFIEQCQIASEEKTAIRSDIMERIHDADQKILNQINDQVDGCDTRESLKDLHDKEAVDVTHLFDQENQEIPMSNSQQSEKEVATESHDRPNVDTFDPDDYIDITASLRHVKTV
ncbi:MAG: hypothetical protein MHMPM18_000798 [Marteilia pararefringens]